MKNPTLKPPLKWVGGKQRILATLLPHIEGGRRLIEPFVGAGSVFLNAPHPGIVINDLNPDLISMYEMLRDTPVEYIERAKALFAQSMHTPDAYLEARRRFNSSADRHERSALFLYLNKFSFNGIYRVNRKGLYNVPYGHPKSLPTFPEVQLLAMAERLKGATIMNEDFRVPMAMAGLGDVVYSAPPYADLSAANSSFVSYTAIGFTTKDHADLVHLASEACARGATVVISNHDTEFVRALYAKMELHSIDVRRSIAADGDRRGKAKELIAVLRPS